MVMSVIEVIVEIVRLGVVIDDGVKHDILCLRDGTVGIAVRQRAIPEALTSSAPQLRVTDAHAAGTGTGELLPKLSCKQEEEGLVVH